MNRSNLLNNNDYDNDDLFMFQLDSSIINLSYSQLVRYSKHIREKYVFSDAINLLPKEIHEFQEKFQLSSENIIFFFQLLKQNYDINNNSNLTYEQCIDLLKISKCLEVRKLSILINKYIEDHSFDVDFIIQIIQHANKFDLEIKIEMENLLSNKIDQCLSNDKFAELPIEVIYRIIKRSPSQMSISDKVFKLIKKSIRKYAILLSFVKLEELPNDQLEDLCEIYLKCDENEQQYFNYMNCNLKIIDAMNKNKKKMEKELESIEKASQKQISELEIKIKQLQEELKETTKSKNKAEEENHKLQAESRKIIKILSVQTKERPSIDFNFINYLNQENQKYFIHSTIIYDTDFKNKLKEDINYLKIFDVVVLGGCDSFAYFANGIDQEAFNFIKIYHNQNGIVLFLHDIMYNRLVDIFHPLGKLIGFKKLNPLLGTDKKNFFNTVKLTESMKTNEILSNPFNIGNTFPVVNTHHSPEYDSKYVVLIDPIFKQNYYIENLNENLADCQMGHNPKITKQEQQLFYNIICHLYEKCKNNKVSTKL